MAEKRFEELWKCAYSFLEKNNKIVFIKIRDAFQIDSDKGIMLETSDGKYVIWLFADGTFDIAKRPDDF